MTKLQEIIEQLTEQINFEFPFLSGKAKNILLDKALQRFCNKL